MVLRPNKDYLDARIMTANTKQNSITFIVLVCGTVLGLAGIDLVLPAIPSLPASIQGSIESAQLVLATFAAGTAIGLLIYGELGARFKQRYLLIVSLALYAALSLLASTVSTINELILVRFFQGLVSSAPAVFAPGMIKAIFDERGALKAIGLMGSIEALTPAFAPVVGAWLLTFFDWRASFIITAALAAILCLSTCSIKLSTLSKSSTRETGSYLALFANRAFMRQSISHSCTLGGLLVFVFGAPTVITTSMGGGLSDFVIMQLVGISFFIASANVSDRLVAKFGSEPLILFGSAMTALGCISILLFSVIGNNNPSYLWLLFIPVNLGLGLRGPPGFYQAIVESGDNDSRGAALMILFILGAAALGTAAVAPFISHGLSALSLAASIIATSSVLVLLALRVSASHEGQAE